MTTSKISKEVSDLLDPENMKDDGADLRTNVPKLTKPDPVKTQKELDRLLCPDDLKDKPDDPDLKPDPSGLVPDWAREKKGEDEEDDLKLATAKTQTPTEKVSDGQHEQVGLTLGEWIEKNAREQAEKTEKEAKAVEKEKEAIERENDEIKKSFRRLADKKDANDLTPNHYKDQE